jgi:hypothetical protein
LQQQWKRVIIFIVINSSIAISVTSGSEVLVPSAMQRYRMPHLFEVVFGLKGESFCGILTLSCPLITTLMTISGVELVSIGSGRQQIRQEGEMGARGTRPAAHHGWPDSVDRRVREGTSGR